MSPPTFNRRRLLSLSAACLAAGSPHLASATGVELAVIVNTRNKQALTTADLEAIFRATRRHWTDGEPITAFNLIAGSAERSSFDRAVLGLSPEEVARYWIDRRIRGGDPPPRSVASAALVVRLIAQLKTGIGYVPPSLLADGVRPTAWIRKGVLTIAGSSLLRTLEEGLG
jgi:ABC-type phosphate transport system substrate-binding protein